MKTRLLYLDNLKAVLILLVILQHVMGAFVHDNAFFPIHNPETSNVIIPLLGSIGAPFVMGLFFFIAAYFSYDSAQKHQRHQFLIKRTTMLLTAFVTIACIVVPLSFYLAQLPTSAQHFMPFMTDFFSRSHFSVGHGWFLLQLLIFTIIMVYFDKALRYTLTLKLSSFIGLTLIIILYSFALYHYPPGKFYWWNTFEPFHFLPYLLYFYLGWQFKRLNLLDRLTKPMTHFTAMVAVCTILLNIFTLLFLPLKYPVYLFLQAIMSTSLTFTALGYFKFYLNRRLPSLQFIGNYLFSIYIFHLLFVILVDLLIIPLTLNMWLKILIIYPLTVAVTCFFCWLLRKLIPLKIF